MTKKAFFIIVSVISLNLFSTFSQEFYWKAGFSSFFDNREYFNDYAPPGSALGARTFLSAGIKVDEKNEFFLGADFLYEFGDKSRTENFKPILYFHHQGDIEVYMGAFPRNGLFELPNILQTDTFHYFRPNVEGIYLKAENSWGKQDLWLDWTSRQTTTARETFLIGGTGQIAAKMFFARYDFIMYHYAGVAESIVPMNVRDNGGLTAVAGANLSALTPFDSLSISSGLCYSYDRLRSVYETKNYLGSKTELFALYKRFGLRNTLYLGDGQINLVGDKMYTAKFYNRTDLIVRVFEKGIVNGEIEFAFHFLPETMDFSQKFKISLAFGRNKLFNTKNNTL